MTRALVVEAAGNMWGSERALLDLLAGMPAGAAAVCCPPDRQLNAELEKYAIRMFPYYVDELHEKSKWHRGLAALGVLRACLEFEPDTIYLNQSGAYKVGLPAAALLNIPIVAHIRIFEDVAYLARQRPNPSRLRALIAISGAIDDDIRRFEELSAIPRFQVYDAYAPSCGSSQGAAPKRMANRIACVGRLTPIKGQDILIPALRLIEDRKHPVDCLIAGQGSETFVGALKQAATGAGVESSVQWLGFVRNVVPLLESCAVLACPSYREPLGRVILEAWDAGAVPVVFSGSGGAAEIVAAARGGILYHRQTPESLAAALQDALGLNPNQAAELVSNGRSWMARNCDQRASCKAVMRIISGVCRQKF
jgi:glycosyltransferase involved in cell wall biosynthesis